jgi:hypothetical protein
VTGGGEVTFLGDVHVTMLLCGGGDLDGSTSFVLFDYSGGTVTGFDENAFTFAAGPGILLTTTGVTVQNLTGSSEIIVTGFSEFKVLPEPSSLALFGIGLLLVRHFRRRRGLAHGS